MSQVIILNLIFFGHCYCEYSNIIPMKNVNLEMKLNGCDGKVKDEFCSKELMVNIDEWSYLYTGY